MAFWELVQQNSDRFLAEGLNRILFSKDVKAETEVPASAGVFVFLRNEKALYAESTTDLKAAFKTQRDERYSDFYASYRATMPEPVLPITKFSLRFCAINLGRTELRSCARTSLRTPLTPPVAGLKNRTVLPGAHDLWDRIQGIHFNLISEGAEKALQAEHHAWGRSTLPALPGVLMMYGPDDQLLFVDETHDLEDSYVRHGSTGSASTFRRAVGEKQLGFRLQPRGNRTASFSSDQEEAITSFVSGCAFSALPVRFGRSEVAEDLIKQHKPVLNGKAEKDGFVLRYTVPTLLRNRRLFG